MFPEPLVIQPTVHHEQTFVILHGRGDNGDHFGPQFLRWPIGEYNTFHKQFPNAKFVFPTAPRRRVNTGNRPMTNQWFDNYSPLSVELQCKDEERQIEGLRETSMLIHQLLRKEIAIIGAKNVTLGGLSQGCAVSLVAALLWDGPPLRAMFGMCGWLPLRKRMADIAGPTLPDGDGREDLIIKFGHQDDEMTETHDPLIRTLIYLHDELELSQTASESESLKPFQQTPLFLGHGAKDDKVPIGLGREAASHLRTLGIAIEVKEYESLGHWYSEKMLEDLIEFLIRVGKR